MKFFSGRFLAVVVVLASWGAVTTRAQVPVWPKTTPAEIVSAGIGAQITGSDFGNGIFVLAAYLGGTTATPAITPAVWTSADGTTWTRRTLPVTGARVNHVRFVNGKFFLGMDAATNNSGVPTGAPGAIVSSADGITWVAATLTSSLYAPDYFVFGNGVYVAVASPTSGQATQIVSSTDGLTWTARTIAAGALGESVAFFNGKFYSNVNVAGAAALYSSSDGTTWTRVTAAPSNISTSGSLATSGNTLLVPAGTYANAAQILTTDGATFTTAAPGIPLASGDIRYFNGAFVTPAFSTATSFISNQARASFDGRTWATIATTAPASFDTQDVREIVYGNGRYVFVGEFDVFSGTTTVSPGGTNSGGGGTTAPAVSTQPAASQSVSVGGSVTFTFTVTGTGITYQWYFNGVAITGAINFNYTIASVTAANAGSYTAIATNVGGTVTSNASVLTVAAAPATNLARLSNVSIRAGAGSDSQTLIVGVTVGGTGTSGSKTLLVRGTGPALTAFGVPGALADPVLTIFNGTAQLSANDDWSSDAAAAAQITATGNALGAFALTAGSKDAAVVGTIASGGYTVQLTGKAGATGVGLVEVYDATASFTASTPRLTNVSARTQVGTGGNVLITGFVIAGSGTRQVLIRATGPALAGFGVAGTLVDPKLELYNGAGTKLDENDNWVSSTASAQASVGAFALTAGSKDAVLIATLAPGSYTAQVSGVNNTTGVALVEIYELP